MSQRQSWVDTHCHLDAPEFDRNFPQVIEAAAQNGVKAILLPTVKASDCDHVRALASQYAEKIPGLVYTLGIHPLYINQAKESDITILKDQIDQSLSDPRFVGIGEIGLDYFVEGLDPKRQEWFFHAQLDLAEQFQLPVVLHVRRFGGAATFERALQIRRLLKELSIDGIVTETDAPDIPPAWLREEGIAFNEPAFLPRIASVLAEVRGISSDEFAVAVWQNAMQVLPRWKKLMETSR